MRFDDRAYGIAAGGHALVRFGLDQDARAFVARYRHVTATLQSRGSASPGIHPIRRDVRISVSGEPDAAARFRLRAFPVAFSIETGTPSIVRARDGSLWYTLASERALGRITVHGRRRRFRLPRDAEPAALAAGLDGRVWFTTPDVVGGPASGQGSLLGAVSSSGHVVSLRRIRAGAGAITRGPDGNIWFSTGSRIARVLPGGRITRYPIPHRRGEGVGARDLTAGPGHRVWFTDGGTGGGWVDAEGRVRHFSFHLRSARKTGFGGTGAIAAGRDGKLYFTEGDANNPEGKGRIGRLTPGGTSREWTLGQGKIGVDIARGPDRNVWFTSVYPGVGDEPAGSETIGRITPGGELREFPAPHPCTPAALVTGPDRNLWFEDDGYGDEGKAFVCRLALGRRGR